MKQHQRGSILIDALIGLLVVGAVVGTLNYAYRIAEHYTAVWGTVAGFARMYEAERAYRRAGYTGSVDYTVMQVLIPGIKVHSATAAHRNGVGRPYELRTVGGEQMLTTVVDNEAQASQVVDRLAGKATYASETGGFRITYRPSRVDPLERLIQRHAMHVTGPHGTTLKDRLNFGPGAIVAIGTPCLPPDGVHSGGIATDAMGRPVTCVRVAPGTSLLDREWRLVASGSLPPVNPPLLESCGDGTLVTSRSADCKDCPDGSNIVRTGTCPSVVIQRCGNGTAVVDPVSECMDCWDGTNIHIAEVCPPRPIEQCGDGTYVFDRDLECKDCSDGTNVPLTASCPAPIFDFCGDGTLVTNRLTECQDCWDGTNIHVSDSCPPLIFERCGDGTIVYDADIDCKDCPDGSNIPVADTCPVGTTCWNGSVVYAPTVCPTQPTCGDGTLVTNRATDCKDCADGTNIPVRGMCPTGTNCWDGTVVFPPATCPVQPTCGDGTSIINPVTDCKDCPNGTNIPTTASCPIQCSCDAWAPTLADCPRVIMKPCPGGCPDVCPMGTCATPTRTGPTSCIGGFSLVETPGACTITAECVADACPCGLIRQTDGVCPVVVKDELGAETCPNPYIKVGVAETACTITHECQLTCPCEGGTVTHPATCPAIVKDELGPASCPTGYARTKIAENRCSITFACEKVCPCAGGTVTHPAVCPTIVKDELGPVSCPAGYTRTQIDEDQCSITYECQRACPCEGPAVTHPAVCPAIVKDELGPASCPTGYGRSKIAEDQCTVTYACERACPCDGPTVTHPAVCPPIVKRELGATSCAFECDLVTSSETQCTITRACQQTCWDDSVMACGVDCPAKPVSCANGNGYPNCCCPEMTPIETEYEDRIEWSCPPKPRVGFPEGQFPGPHWTVVVTEHECYTEATLVCTGSIGACFGPGNYCASPTQVWFHDETGICTGPTNVLGESCNSGFTCGEAGLGP